MLLSKDILSLLMRVMKCKHNYFEETKVKNAPSFETISKLNRPSVSEERGRQTSFLKSVTLQSGASNEMRKATGCSSKQSLAAQIKSAWEVPESITFTRIAS